MNSVFSRFSHRNSVFKTYEHDLFREPTSAPTLFEAVLWLIKHYSLYVEVSCIKSGVWDYKVVFIDEESVTPIIESDDVFVSMQVALEEGLKKATSYLKEKYDV